MRCCQACGSASPEGAAYCIQCGTPLEQQAPVGPDPSDTRAESGVPTVIETGASSARGGRPVTAPAAVPVKGVVGQSGAGSPSPEVQCVGAGGPSSGCEPVPSSEIPSEARVVSLHPDGRPRAILGVASSQFEVGGRFGDACFADDPYLSDRHCRFERWGQGWRVVDLASHNGVYLRIQGPTPLQRADHVLAGAEVFRFEVPEAHDIDIGPAKRDGVVLFGSPLHPVWGCLRLVTIGGVSRDVYYLHRRETSIGRERADICFPEDEFMSRQHASVDLVDARPTLRDLDSANGTFVRVRGEASLAHGDMLRIGKELVRFELP